MTACRPDTGRHSNQEHHHGEYTRNPIGSSTVKYTRRADGGWGALFGRTRGSYGSQQAQLKCTGAHFSTRCQGPQGRKRTLSCNLSRHHRHKGQDGAESKQRHGCATMSACMRSKDRLIGRDTVRAVKRAVIEGLWSEVYLCFCSRMRGVACSTGCGVRFEGRWPKSTVQFVCGVLIWCGPHAYAKRGAPAPWRSRPTGTASDRSPAAYVYS